MNAVTIKAALAAFELRYTQGGKAWGIATLSAHTDGDKYPAIQKAKIFGQHAENLANVPIGTAILASGKLSLNTWTDKSGNQRDTIEVLLDEAHPTTGSTSTTEKGEPVLLGGRIETRIAGRLTSDAKWFGQTNSHLGITIAVNNWNPKTREQGAIFVSARKWNADQGLPAVKGAFAIAVGTLRLESWTDKEGTKHWRDTLDMRTIEIAGMAAPTPTSVAARPAPAAPAPAQTTLDIDDEFPPEEDLPF